MTRALAILLVVLEGGCYLAHERAGDAGAVARDGGHDVTLDAPPDTGARLCGCPGSPTARVCVLPLMCCPATETCEDPAHFSCTGTDPCR